MKLDSKIPEGPLAEKWTKHKFNLKLVNPANKRKYDVIVVGTCLAGASAAASLGELGYNVKAFCFQDSPRRAHSIAAQVVLTLPKIIKTMAIVFIGCFTIPSKVAIIELAKEMFIAWQKSASTSLTNA